MKKIGKKGNRSGVKIKKPARRCVNTSCRRTEPFYLISLIFPLRALQISSISVNFRIP